MLKEKRRKLDGASATKYSQSAAVGFLSPITGSHEVNYKHSSEESSREKVKCHSLFLFVEKKQKVTKLAYLWGSLRWGR